MGTACLPLILHPPPRASRLPWAEVGWGEPNFHLCPAEMAGDSSSLSPGDAEEPMAASGGAGSTAARGGCSRCSEVPAAAPGLSQHQNLGRLLVSSSREGGIASFGSSPHQTRELSGTQPMQHTTHPARNLFAGAGKRQRKTSRQRQVLPAAIAGVLPVPTAPTAHVHPSPARPPWRRKGRSRHMATHRAQH